MEDNHFPSPWGSLLIPKRFSEVIKVETGRTLIYGPFALRFEYRDDSSSILDKPWPQYSDEYALYLELHTGENGMWSWFSNRYHYFLPDKGVFFQKDVLHCVCTEQDRRFKHLAFKPLTQTEWSSFLGNELPESVEERIRIITGKFWS